MGFEQMNDSTTMCRDQGAYSYVEHFGVVYYASTHFILIYHTV